MEWLLGSSAVAWVKDLLTKRQSGVEIVVREGGTINVVQGDQHIHYHINGPAEVLQPKPAVGRVLPLRVEFASGTVEGGPVTGADPVLTKTDDG